MVCKKRGADGVSEQAKEVEQKKFSDDFERVTTPVIEWIAKNMHPHSKIIIDCNTAELLEGVVGFQNDKFIPD